jgi:hypothetical protein
MEGEGVFFPFPPFFNKFNVFNFYNLFCLTISYLSLSKISHNTVSAYLSAITFPCKIAHHEGFVNNLLVSKMLEGMRRVHKTVDTCCSSCLNVLNCLREIAFALQLNLPWMWQALNCILHVCIIVCSTNGRTNCITPLDFNTVHVFHVPSLGEERKLCLILHFWSWCQLYFQFFCLGITLNVTSFKLHITCMYHSLQYKRSHQLHHSSRFWGFFIQNWH